jgi:hypothetical protein
MEAEMARQAEWQREIREAIGKESATVAWSLNGPNRLVKVTRPSAIMNRANRARAVGYVTQEKFLFGKTPIDIERALGLPPLCFTRGCRIFRLERLPRRGEYNDELTAVYPGGLAFNPADALEGRERYLNDRSLHEVPYYPPGDARIPQWDVTVSIPLVHLIDLAPTVSYPRA